MEYEKELELLGIFWYTPAINEDVSELFEYCDERGFKKWLISKSDKSKSIALAYQSKFYNRGRELIDIDEEQESDLLAKMKGILLRMKEEMTRHKFGQSQVEERAMETDESFRMKDIAFSGKVLDVISKNESLERKLVVFCMSFENIMAYNLENKHLNQIPQLFSKYQMENKFLILYQDH